MFEFLHLVPKCFFMVGLFDCIWLAGLLGGFICKSIGFYQIIYSWELVSPSGQSTLPKEACSVLHQAKQLPFSCATNRLEWSLLTHYPSARFSYSGENRPIFCHSVIFTYWSFIRSPLGIPGNKMNLIWWPQLNVCTSEVESIIV